MRMNVEETRLMYLHAQLVCSVAHWNASCCSAKRPWTSIDWPSSFVWAWLDSLQLTCSAQNDEICQRPRLAIHLGMVIMKHG